MALTGHASRPCRADVLALAAAGLRMPIGTDLVLRERADAEAILEDGGRLADVVAEAAARYRTPLAVPLMDLQLEKADLLGRIRPGVRADGFQFEAPPESVISRSPGRQRPCAFATRQRAQIDAIALVAERPGLVPLGMAIGPFSLATRLLADPIGAVALAGAGLTADEEPLVAAIERCLELAKGAVLRSLRAQLAAGAAMVVVCEPAASTAYVSPLQVAAGSPVFERFVVEPLLALGRTLDAGGALLFLHDCGELSDSMLESPGGARAARGALPGQLAAAVGGRVASAGRRGAVRQPADEALPLGRHAAARAHPRADPGARVADARGRMPLHPRLRVRRAARAGRRGRRSAARSRRCWAETA